MKKKNRWLLRTLLLLALCVLFRALGVIFPGLGHTAVGQIVIGTLANAMLVLTAWTVGWGTGMIVALLAAVIDFFVSGGQYFWTVPFIALGDGVLILLTWAIRKYKVYGVVLGAAGKFLFLYYVLGVWVLPWLVETDIVPMKAAQALLSHADYLQFVNALLGGILALILWHKFLKKRKR